MLLAEYGYRTERTDRVVLIDEDEARLTDWMHTHLHLSWCEHPDPAAVEVAVIAQWGRVSPVEWWGYTDEEIRSFVYEYERQPYGTKGAWIKVQPFTMGQFRRWRTAVYDGDLDRGLVPRDRRLMTPPDRRRRIANQDARADADSE